jgi:putative ABC transport system permease protein
VRPARTFARLLLRCYPRAFRDRFGAEFVAFAEARARETRPGAWALALVLDVARSAPAAHAHARAVRAPRLEAPPPENVMDTLRHDLRFALRTAVRRPGFAAVVALTLALGIGATAAIFSVVNAVLLQTLPWPAADRLVALDGETPNGPTGLSYPDFEALRAVRGFEEVGVIRGQSVNLTGVERPERLYGLFVSASTLRLLGAVPALGRTFTDAETEPATRAAVAILADETWRARFGADPSVVGRTITLNGQPFTVVGVAPKGLATPFGETEVWLPIAYYPNAGGLERGAQSLSAYARLKPGVSRATAAAQAASVARALAAQYPQSNAGLGVRVQDLKESLVGDARSPLRLLLAAVGVLLLIACLNVANLQLARAVGRQRETALRAAIGATGSRLARGLLAECLVLAALGGVLGLALGRGLLAVLVRTVGADLPAFGGVAMDARVLGVAALATVGAALLTAVAPVWRATRRGSAAAGLGARDSSAARGAARGRSALVVAQMALSVMLLATAGLLARSLAALRQVDPGFDPRDLLTLEFRLPPTKYDAPAKIAVTFERMLAEVRAAPGVSAAALVRAVPLGGNVERYPAAFDGRPMEDPARALSVHVNVVSEGYFATMRLPLRAGRDFDTHDAAGAPRVVVVNETLARRVWPGASALGRRVRLANWPDEWATVVGVAAGAKHTTLTEPVEPQVYVPYRQQPLIFTGVVARTAGDPEARAEAVRRAIWRVDPDQPVWRVRPMTAVLGDALGHARALARLTAAFALVALTLAAVGVFGVTSFLVAQRRREMGIRIALGARRAQVTTLVVGHGARLVAAALLLGGAGALATGRLVAGELYGVGPHDAATLAAVAAVLGVVALGACWLPARRAGRVDPRVTLGGE